MAYLKIFKIFHEKANRKMPPKFESLATNLFAELMQSNKSEIGNFYDFFIEFLAEAVFSSITGIRITAARMLFHLLKNNGHPGTKAR